MRVKGRSVLLLERFDRDGQRRIPYLSGMTAVQGSDGGRYSYLDLVAFIEQYGSRPDDDIRELWKRILFSVAIGNTDDHMRNHGFLREGPGWRLSPVFDVNPTPGDNPKYLASAIDYDSDEALPDVAIAACEWYRVSRDDAAREVRAMVEVLVNWRKVAGANGISQASIEHMSTCFDAGIQRLKATLE